MLSIGTYTRKREDLQKNKKNGVLDDKGPIYVIVGVGIGHDGGYLNETAPDWSAIRDDSIFGFGGLELTSKEEATYTPGLRTLLRRGRRVQPCLRLVTRFLF